MWKVKLFLLSFYSLYLSIFTFTCSFENDPALWVLFSKRVSWRVSINKTDLTWTRFQSV